MALVSEEWVAVDVDGAEVLTAGRDWYETNTSSPWLGIWWMLLAVGKICKSERCSPEAEALQISPGKG